MEKKCLVCDKIISKKVNVSVWYYTQKKKFCSRKCKGISQLGHLAWNKGIKYTDVQKKNLNLSGLKLGYGWNRGKRYIQISGYKHHNWKGGITPKNKALRESIECKNWRI